MIDETFGVPGVGTVVAGTVKRGVITPNTTLLLGEARRHGTARRHSVSFQPTAVAHHLSPTPLAWCLVWRREAIV